MAYVFFLFFVLIKCILRFFFYESMFSNTLKGIDNSNVINNSGNIIFIEIILTAVTDWCPLLLLLLLLLLIIIVVSLIMITVAVV